MARKEKSKASPESAPKPKKGDRPPHPAPEAAGRVLYVAGEDGNFYAIPEEAMKRSFAVAEDDPVRKVLESYLAFGVVHTRSQPPSGEVRGNGFFTISSGPVATGKLPFDFVDLGPASPPPAEDAPSEEPKRGKKKKKHERKD